MAQPARSGDSSGSATTSPHSLSLKVLRLSHPSLSPAHALSGDDPLAKASLSYPSAPTDSFPLSSLLSLPPGFGAAYVGTLFTCTLCVNNELTSSSPPSTTIRDVQVSAELQVPSGSIPMTLEGADTQDGEELKPAQSLQKIVRHQLKEDGQHVLAVTVTYTEVKEDTTNKRTFRKLYQFAAGPALGVRTKVGDLTVRANTPSIRKFVLEAQLENLTQDTLILEKASINTAKSLQSKSMNWGVDDEKPILNPQDVAQIAFTLEQIQGETLEEKNSRVILAQLCVGWRGPMGEEGNLTTGWLGSRG